MADFYSILRKSILDRGIADSDERDAIYAQARRAMIRRLWSFEPPLDEEEIDRRIAAFDVAVSDIEADVMATFSAVDDAPAEADPYAADPYETDDHEPDAYEADDYEADNRETAYRKPAYQEAERGEPENRPAADSRRLPALVQPGNYARKVREAELVHYYEEARRIEPEPREPPYDDAYDAPYEDADEPPAGGPGSIYPRRRTPEPPVDPYQDEPGYEPPPPPRRQSRKDRWSADDAFRDPREPQRRQPAQAPAQRRQRLDEEAARRRQRPSSRQPLSDRDKIYMLLGAIGVCALVLGGIGVYVLMPRDTGVTVDIDGHQEVSDAATAVRLAAQAMPVDQTFMLFDGRDPTVFETSPDNPIRFDAGAGTVRVSSSAGSPGVKALIGPGLATRLAGRNVRVTIVARSSKDAGAASMRFAYQSGVAISHWQTANLGPDYQAVALTWRVPTLRTDRTGDLLVIQPGVPGDGTGADIKSIKIDVLAS